MAGFGALVYDWANRIDIAAPGGRCETWLKMDGEALQRTSGEKARISRACGVIKKYGVKLPSHVASAPFPRSALFLRGTMRLYGYLFKGILVTNSWYYFKLTFTVIESKVVEGTFRAAHMRARPEANRRYCRVRDRDVSTIFRAFCNRSLHNLSMSAFHRSSHLEASGLGPEHGRQRC